MKKLVVALAVLPLLALLALFAADGNSAPPADAAHVVYTIDQFPSLPPTVVEPLVGGLLPIAGGGTESVIDFYGYCPSSCVSPFVPASTKQTALTLDKVSVLFLYQQFLPGPSPNGHPVISLVMIHDEANIGSTNPGGSAEFDFFFDFLGVPTTPDWVVEDDPASPIRVDNYTITPLTASTATGNAKWAWGDCCTDGGAIQGGLDDEFCITVDPLLFQNISEWVFLTAPGGALAAVVPPLDPDNPNPVRIYTPAGCPPSVGGIAELRGDADSLAEASGFSTRDYAAPVAAAVAGGIIALVGGWYARRRWLR